MIRCPRCNKELEDGSKFCDACGARIFETVFCPNCGEKTSTEFAFCQKCGAPIMEDTDSSKGSVAPTKLATAPSKSTIALSKPVKEKRSPKSTVVFGGIGVAVLAAIFLVVTLFSGSGNNHEYSLYFKDGEIVYTDYSEKGTFELTSRLFNGESIDDAEMADNAHFLRYYIDFSEDGKRVFFPDRVDSDSDGITLYYRDIDKPEEDAIKIDSEVTSYAINSAGTKVAYVKGSDGILYINDLTDKEKIASGVASFNATDDLSKIGYLNDENSYYFWYAKKDSVKLASDITSIEKVDSDLSVVYYIKDGSLYKYSENGEDTEKIASDISEIIKIYDSGEIYYTKADSVETSLLDYVTDDMKDADAATTKPVSPDYPDSPDYPSWWDYDTVEEYDAAYSQYEADYEAYAAVCDQIYAEYEAAYDAYRAKRDRDTLRQNLENVTVENTVYTLYFFDGKEASIVTDALASEYDLTCASDKPVVSLPIYNQANVQKVKLSEVSTSSEVSDMVKAARRSSVERCIAVGTSLSVLEQTDARQFIFTPNGSTIYFLDDISDSNCGDLYKAAIADGQVGNPEMYDSDVSNWVIYFSATDKLTYYKNVDVADSKGDLYINGEEIDYDVYLWNVSHQDDVVLYYTDWNSEKNFGTLKMYENGTKTKIADDVHDFESTGDGDILYLYDYSVNYYTGTLYLYNNGKPKKIDDDVVALIPVYTDHGIRGL